MIGWLKTLLAINKILGALREFFIYIKARQQGRQEQADRQAKQDDETVKRGNAARDEYERGGLRKEAARYHVDE